MYDGTKSIAGSAFVFTPLGQIWTNIHSKSLQLLQPAIERPSMQARFGEASAELNCAELLLRANLESTRAFGQMTTLPTTLQLAEIRRNVVYAARLVTNATNRLLDGVASSGLKDEALIARQAADVRAAGLQVVLHPDETLMDYARVYWGLEPETVLL